MAELAVAPLTCDEIQQRSKIEQWYQARRKVSGGIRKRKKVRIGLKVGGAARRRRGEMGRRRERGRELGSAGAREGRKNRRREKERDAVREGERVRGKARFKIRGGVSPDLLKDVTEGLCEIWELGRLEQILRALYLQPALL